MCLGLISLGWLHGQDSSCDSPKESLTCTQYLFQLQCPRPGTDCIHRAGKIKYYKMSTAGIYALFLYMHNYSHMTLKTWKLNLTAILSKSWPHPSAMVFAVVVKSSLICFWRQEQRAGRAGYEITHVHAHALLRWPLIRCTGKCWEVGRDSIPSSSILFFPSCPRRKCFCFAVQKVMQHGLLLPYGNILFTTRAFSAQKILKCICKL